MADDALDIGLFHELRPCHRHLMHQKVSALAILDDILVVARVAGEHRDAAAIFEAISVARLDEVAVVDLYVAGEAQPRRVTLDAAVFGKLATARPMGELLIAAPPAKRAPKPRAAAAAGGERADYGTLEHAGKPHKGKTTAAEKQLVREHLAEINKRLAAEGLRTVDLADPGHVERYGLEDLAAD